MFGTINGYIGIAILLTGTLIGWYCRAVVDGIGGEDMSITETIEDVKEDICNNYCKYPGTWDEKKEGCELCESDVCKNCPLNRL